MHEKPGFLTYRDGGYFWVELDQGPSAGIPLDTDNGGGLVRHLGKKATEAWLRTEHSRRIPSDPEIEQRDGARFPRNEIEALQSGWTNDAVAAPLRHLWKVAPARAVGKDATAEERWTELQAIAFLATRNLAIVGKLATPIEYTGTSGGRLMLSRRQIMACLQREVGTRHCACGARKARTAEVCRCLEIAQILFETSQRLGRVTPAGRYGYLRVEIEGLTVRERGLWAWLTGPASRLFRPVSAGGI